MKALKSEGMSGCWGRPKVEAVARGKVKERMPAKADAVARKMVVNFVKLEVVRCCAILLKRLVKKIVHGTKSNLRV